MCMQNVSLECQLRGLEFDDIHTYNRPNFEKNFALGNSSKSSSMTRIGNLSDIVDA